MAGSVPAAKFRRCFLPLLLVVAVLAAYANALFGTFQFDDYNVIVFNKSVHSFQQWLSDLDHGIRPVLKFSYMLNWVSGVGLFGFHMVNIAIHVLNVLLFYHVAAAVAQVSNPEEGEQAVRIAFWAALLFALHPVHTEAVTYISGRSSSLMALFYLSSLLVYMYASSPETNRYLLLYICSPLLFILAVLTKETAVTLPLVLLLADRVRANAPSLISSLKKQAAHWGILFFLLAASIAHPTQGKLLEYSFEIRSVTVNLLTQIHGVSYLISRLFMPHRLNIDPDLPVITSWTPFVSAEAVMLLSFLVVAVINRNKRKWLFFGTVWFYIHLLPTNSIVPRLDVANERQLYLAAPGLYFLFAHRAERLLTVMRVRNKIWLPLAAAAGISLFVACGVFTICRNHVYRSEISLWEDTRKKSPGKVRVHNNLGYAYSLAGRSGDAEKAFAVALELDPENLSARKNLLRLRNRF